MRHDQMVLGIDGDLHLLPKGVHRIRHYGLLAGGNRAANHARMRELLGMAAPATEAGPAAEPATPEAHTQLCPCCGGRMRIIEVFQPGSMPCARASPASALRSDRPLRDILKAGAMDGE